jgi:hypothetical protein
VNWLIFGTVIVALVGGILLVTIAAYLYELAVDVMRSGR